MEAIASRLATGTRSYKGIATRSKDAISSSWHRGPGHHLELSRFTEAFEVVAEFLAAEVGRGCSSFNRRSGHVTFSG